MDANVRGHLPDQSVRQTFEEDPNVVYVVANNDLKCEICKSKTAQFAREHGERILWAQCIDTAHDGACKQKLDDLESRAKGGALKEKQSWMTRPDRICGNLYGMLPLVKGLPVMLTEQRQHR